MDPNQNPNQNQNNFNNAVNNFTNTPDATGAYDPADIEKNKVVSLFSYLAILFLIPMFTAKDSPYARFHVNQGIVLFILDIVLNIISVILSFIPVVGTIVSWVVYLIIAVFTILGVINAVTGKAKQLPIIGGITILK